MSSTLYAAVLFSLFASSSFAEVCFSRLVLKRWREKDQHSFLGLRRASVRTRVHEGQDGAFTLHTGEPSLLHSVRDLHDGLLRSRQSCSWLGV